MMWDGTFFFGNDIFLDRAIEKSIRVSPTDISVLITGESGVGKEIFPKIIRILFFRYRKPTNVILF